jgi:hypothetical protein
MDEKITLSEQMEEENVGPVILINKFNVKPEEVDGFPRAWAAEAEIMKRQPGFISTQLHHGIADSSGIVIDDKGYIHTNIQYYCTLEN